MSATSAVRSTHDDDGRLNERRDLGRRRATETKLSFKTTEFFAYLAAVAGVLIAAAVVDDNHGGGFGAKPAWLYVTILTVGYMLSRGLAKSGSRQPYSAENHS